MPQFSENSSAQHVSAADYLSIRGMASPGTPPLLFLLVWGNVRQPSKKRFCSRSSSDGRDKLQVYLLPDYALYSLRNLSVQTALKPGNRKMVGYQNPGCSICDL
jgi:hypothetical protein